jgi:chorismate-pyruvate lyase
MRDFFTSSGVSLVEAPSGGSSEGEPSNLQSWAALLEWVYLRAGLEMPRLRQLKPEQVLNPYRKLLVHSADMTPTLEGFFREPLGLTVLSRDVQEDSYRREVVLTLGQQRRPVLYGAIRILLPHLPPKVREGVLAEAFPLGHILQAESVPHLSWPQAFFQAEPDSHMVAMLRLRGREPLYGRRNVLVDGSRRLLAEVIEVLGPVDSAREPAKGREP